MCVSIDSILLFVFSEIHTCRSWLILFCFCGPDVSLTLCCFVVYSTRRFALCLTLCHFVLVFFSPF